MSDLKQIGTLGKDSEATRVYDPNGISRTIKNGGGMGSKTGLYMIHHNRKYQIKTDFFRTIDSEEKAYWLGFIFADGSISSEKGRFAIAVAESDKDHLQKMNVTIGANKDLYYSDKNKSFRLTIDSIDIKKDLIALGAIPNKTYSCCIPNLPDKFMNHFIRGYFDGDGCLTNTEAVPKFGMVGNIDFLTGVKNVLIKNIGLSDLKFRHDKRHDERIVSLEYGGRINAVLFGEYIYQDASVYLERKYQKFLSIAQSKRMKSERIASYAVKQIGTKNDSNDGTQPFQQDRVYDSDGISPALQSGLPGGAHKIVTSRGRGDGWKQTLEERKDELTNTLTGVEKDNMVSNGTRIRRLTPIECERLQDYPDNYTAIGMNEKGEEVPISDSQRYKVLGNSVTVSVIEAIIEKLFRINGDLL